MCPLTSESIPLRRPMFEIVTKRFLYSLTLFLGITVLSFLVIHLVPGTPGEAAGGMNPQLGADAAEKLNRLYGLDKPIWEQYSSWFSKTASLNLGESLVDGKKVSDKILEVLPVTLVINGASLILTLIFGIPLGVWLALRKGSRGEKTAGFVSMAVISIPSFWISLVLMSSLGVGLRLFPVSGLRSFFYDDLPWWLQCFDLLWHLTLPVLILSLAGVAAFSRYVKSSMEEVLQKDFIRSARARGLSEYGVIYGHALKNALLPVITLLGLSIPGLLGGSVVLESVFSIPGMGRLFYGSVLSRDYPVIMGILVLGAVLTLLGNALADFAYAMADPRIRVPGKAS